jgi:hypothetical protein
VVSDAPLQTGDYVHDYFIIDQDLERFLIGRPGESHVLILLQRLASKRFKIALRFQLRRVKGLGLSGLRFS